MTLRAELLRQADAYCDKHNITRARLGVLVMKDNKFFADLEKGRGFTSATYEKFQRFFDRAKEAQAESAVEA